MQIKSWWDNLATLGSCAQTLLTKQNPSLRHLCNLCGSKKPAAHSPSIFPKASNTSSGLNNSGRMMGSLPGISSTFTGMAARS